MQYQRDDRGLTEIAPQRCSNGHRLRSGETRVGFRPCYCAGTGGHRTYRCRTCGVIDFDPPHDPQAQSVVGFKRT